MHGILLKGLKEFVVEEYDRRTWNDIRDEAPVDRKVYLPIETYDDDELEALVAAATTVVDRPADAFLDAYGRSIAGRLLDTYGNVVDDDWSAPELLANVERVHETLRTQNENMNPPRLEVERDAPNRLVVRYESYRRLCPVAKGIVRGVGDRFGQTFGVTERQCMHDGAGHCELVVTF